jgi:intraflagellar transport protein 20
MAAERVSITFDDNNNIRVLEASLFNDCQTMQTESYEFINKMKKFEEMVGSLVDVLDGQAVKIEQEKLKAVGIRNQLENEAENRKKKQQELELMINEKRAELERYLYQLESLTKVEEDQRKQIERLRNNEA